MNWHECEYDHEECEHDNLCPTCQSDLEYEYNVIRIGESEAMNEPDRDYSEFPLSQDETKWMRKCLKNPKILEELV